MKIPNECDIVVIGGGPAGSLAATFLSQNGYHVVLLEKAKHPRPHVGESLIPHFWKYCDSAGVSDKIAAEGFLGKAGGTIFWNDKVQQFSFLEFGYTRPALHVERDRFDQIILENAREKGAQIFEEVAVLDVKFSDDVGGKQTVNYRFLPDKTLGTINCQFVVDASGQNSVVAKQLGCRVFDESFRFMSMWGYFKNSKYMGCDGKAHPRDDLSKVPMTTLICSIPGTGDWGWSWHIPLRERTSVGLIFPHEFIKAAKRSGESSKSFFLRQCYDHKILSQMLETAQYCEGSFGKIQDYSYRSTQIAGSGFFLIGDAAGFVDPIFSVGMTFGMYSASLVAWAIDRCLKKPQSCIQTQALFSHQLQGRLEVSRSLALPHYLSESQASELAKKAIQFESGVEQELMSFVSTILARGDNFKDLIAVEKQEQSDNLTVIR
ncbi:tryptophan 7-halogenase [Oscillatoriales cyanobacterium LEGE 11467]|uniref:Tryptophan 7-halogenase n=1 Tax=Zarconia navalis LEGE 11467 TaxID=1828826 RepID=A0A928Z854_9CYAN|nr:NAD(P)/FAD-dependent oxidoreductase [Zarconia navalis]MBE9039476.1 tryptophan 7-halogenase [Zarconia navalis LEGE 11467]